MHVCMCSESLYEGSTTVEEILESILMLFRKLHVKAAFEMTTQRVNIQFDGRSMCVIECVLQKAEARRYH